MGGSDVNVKYDSNHFQPNEKLYKEKAEVVRLLIEHGADVTVTDESYSTPLHLASSWGNLEIMRLLKEHGADITAQDVSRRTPLHLASDWVSAKAVSLLFHHRPDINV